MEPHVTSRVTGIPGSVHVRPATPQDVDGVAAMTHWCSRRTISLRFMGGVCEQVASAELEREVRVAAPLGEAFVAETDDGKLVGEAYAARSGPDEAEVAFVVADRWQRHGVGTALLAALLRRLQTAHIHAVWAETSSDNIPMLQLLRDAGLPAREEHDGGSVRIRLQLAEPAAPAVANASFAACPSARDGTGATGSPSAHSVRVSQDRRSQRPAAPHRHWPSSILPRTFTTSK
jgi:GNAT superfamily N-acetyltransferase